MLNQFVVEFWRPLKRRQVTFSDTLIVSLANHEGKMSFLLTNRQIQRFKKQATEGACRILSISK